MVAKILGIFLVISPVLMAQGFALAPVAVPVRMQAQDLACNRSNKAWPGEPIRMRFWTFSIR